MTRGGGGAGLSPNEHDNVTPVGNGFPGYNLFK